MFQAKLIDVKNCRRCTPKDLVGKQISEFKNTRIAFYSPANANWCYQLYVVYYNDSLYTVVTQFGEILGA